MSSNCCFTYNIPVTNNISDTLYVLKLEHPYQVTCGVDLFNINLLPPGIYGNGK